MDDNSEQAPIGPRPARRHHTYEESGVKSIHNHDFVDDPRFLRAYQRSAKASGRGPQWRIHIALSCAKHASKLPGDFVECGVNRGMVSTAVLAYLPWSTLNKRFFLLDTWAGMDERYLLEEERQAGYVENSRASVASGKYTSNVDAVRANFAEWERVFLVQGPVPETLSQIDSAQVAYLHIDMNCAPPEVAAIEYFWPKLVGGGTALFDDYAYYKHGPQKAALDEWAKSKDVEIMSLPTGQGLLLKPGVEVG